MLAMLGTGISGDDFVGIVIAVLITAYLFFALLMPEKL
jgi:K+-transporting ATPase KdpF subunit